MKISFKVAVYASIGTLLFAGCSKGDVTSSDSLSAAIASDATVPDLSKCKIRRIYEKPIGEEGNYMGLFSYNKAGNPYSVLFFPKGPWEYYFFYDTQNRLIAHTEYAYGITARHYYRHNAAGQIVIDSAIYPGSDLKDTTIYVSTIAYDWKGRVVKETIVNTRNDGLPLDRTRRPTYTYDNRGNLGVNGWKSSSYDYKINPLRQNPVFQFIHRNYSMNNPSVQPKYNSKGLPLSLSPSNDVFFNFNGIPKIVYDCQ
jgi:hypothetical protein